MGQSKRLHLVNNVFLPNSAQLRGGVKNGILSVANSTRCWIKIPWTGLVLHFDYISCDVHEHRARVQTVIWLANLLRETIAWFLLCLHTLTYLLQPTQGFWSSRICETSPHGSAQEAHLTQPLELYETSHATSSGGSNMRIAAHLCEHRKWGTISSPPIKGWWKVAFGPRTLCDATAQLCRTSDRPTPSSVVPGNYSSPALPRQGGCGDMSEWCTYWLNSWH